MAPRVSPQAAGLVLARPAEAAHRTIGHAMFKSEWKGWIIILIGLPVVAFIMGLVALFIWPRLLR